MRFDRIYKPNHHSCKLFVGQRPFPTPSIKSMNEIFSAGSYFSSISSVYTFSTDCKTLVTNLLFFFLLYAPSIFIISHIIVDSWSMLAYFSQSYSCSSSFYWSLCFLTLLSSDFVDFHVWHLYIKGIFFLFLSFINTVNLTKNSLIINIWKGKLPFILISQAKQNLHLFRILSVINLCHKKMRLTQ